MELFDIVNINDEIIGTTDRETAHKTGQLHRVAAVYVFNISGQLYVQVYKKSGGLYDHSIGGHVSKGETYAQGATREAKEELGISQPLQELSIFHSDESQKFMHMFGLYTCVAEPTWKFIPNDEVEEVIPMEIQDIQKLMANEPNKFTTGFITTMKEYIRLKNIKQELF
jgi:isopentenyl-diphosphate Delta-isomerase